MGSLLLWRLPLASKGCQPALKGLTGILLRGLGEPAEWLCCLQHAGRQFQKIRKAPLG